MKTITLWCLQFILCMIFHSSHCNRNLSLSVVIMIRNNLEAALPRSVLVVKNMVMVSHLMIVIWHSFLPASRASKLRGSDWFYPWVFFGRYAIVSCEVIWSMVYSSFMLRIMAFGFALAMAAFGQVLYIKFDIRTC